jgi:DNA-binding transcriptional LysR family regulator
MTLEQLRVFVAVAERQHLTQAAEYLHLSPSAVSAAVKALEERYAAKLFNRVGRRIELTATGRDFVPEAKAALTAASGAEQFLRAVSGLRRGLLRVQASQTIASYWIPPVLLRYQAAHPGIELRLGAGNTETVGAAVIDGSADLGFIEGELADPALDERVVAEDRLLVVTAPVHRWADGHVLAVSEIAAARWVVREAGSGTRSVFLAALAERGIAASELDIALTLPANEAVLAAVMEGDVAGVVSERVAATGIAAGRLVRANYQLPPRSFRMLWHRQRYRSHAARAFEALLDLPPAVSSGQREARAKVGHVPEQG